jgi:SAM-dependent methyltransferase
MTWSWEVAERDHEIQNPLSPEKITLLGDYLRLTPESRVLDIACGKAGPALILASNYGCRIVGVEQRATFADEARARIAEQGLESRIEVHTADAAEFPLEPEAWDAALCIGAAFVWGTIAEAAVALWPAVRPGGFVAIGEPFWRRSPPPEGGHPGDFVGLQETVGRFEGVGLATTGVIAASDDDWDHYRSLHWRAVEEWLAEQPDHPDAPAIRTQHEERRESYFRVDRAALGWAIFVGRKPDMGSIRPV